MKKRLLSLLTAAALLCTLLSTTALARETDFFDAWPEDVDFSTLTWGPADAGELYGLLEELKTACAQPDNEARVLELMEQVETEWEDLQTRYAVCTVAYYRDVTAVAQDYVAWGQLMVEAQNAYILTQRELLQSQYGQALAQAVGMEAEELLAQLTPDDQRQQELMSRDQDLINDYWTAVGAEYEVTWQDRSWTQAELDQDESLTPEEAGQVQRLLDQARNAAAVSILLEMVEVRNEYARSKGYDNYASYAYENVYYRDYSLEDAQQLYGQVKEEIAPLLNQIPLVVQNREELFDDQLSEYVADLTQEETLELVEPCVEEVSSEYAELFRYMRENNLADIGPLDTKMDVGFTTHLPAYRSAVMFNCPSGSYYDVESLLHEFGHYAEMCLSDAVGGGFECIDVAEIDSQGLELLSLNFADQMFPQAGDAYRVRVLYQLLTNVANGCLMDEFQAALYAGGDWTAEELNALMEELLEEYDIVGMFGDNSDYNWVLISHTFESPMYYISYATSALSALELFLDAQTDFDGAADTYLNLVAMGTGLGYREAVREAGLSDIFQTGAVSALAQRLQDYLNGQVYDLPQMADLEGHWSSDAALFCTAVGLFRGDGAGSFRPDGTMTRAQMVTILWRLMGQPDPEGAPVSFTDVADGAWYAQAVQWAAQTGIVKGTGSARFEPDGLVTWEQLAVMLDRLLGEDSALGGELDSQGVLTRGEAAVLFQRLLTGDLAA